MNAEAKFVAVERLRRIVQREMRIQEVDVHELATRSDLDPLTVYRYVDTHTKSPHQTTTESLLYALGFRLIPRREPPSEIIQ